MKNLVAGLMVVLGVVVIVLMGGANIARAADSAAQAQANSIQDRIKAEQDRITGLVFQKADLGTRIEIVRLTRRKAEIAKRITDLNAGMRNAGNEVSRSAGQAKITRLQEESALLDELMGLLPRLVPAIQQKQKDQIDGLDAQIVAKREAIRKLRAEDGSSPVAVSTKPVARTRQNPPVPDPELRPLLDQIKDLGNQIRVLQDRINQLRAQERSLRAQH